MSISFGSLRRASSRNRIPVGSTARSRAIRTSRSRPWRRRCARSEEHTSELQSHLNLVCRLLLEKKKNKDQRTRTVLALLDLPDDQSATLLAPRVINDCEAT